MALKRIIPVFLLVVVTVLTALLFWPTKAPRRSLPEPNGYEALIAAAERLDRPPDHRNVSPRELRAYVEANYDSLRSVKEALDLECMVTSQLDLPDYMMMHSSDLIVTKRAALALDAEGKIFEADGNFNEAARSYLCAIRLGQNITRNGCAIDMMVGIACETIGAQELSKIATNLTATTCSHLLNQLDSWERNREPLIGIEQNERYFINSQRDWDSIKSRLAKLFTEGRITPDLDSYWQKYAERSNSTKLLMTRLAAHAYELQHGRKPQSFDDLVPEYLPTQPTDYLSGTNLVYDFGK